METVIAGKIRRTFDIVDLDIVESVSGGFFFNLIFSDNLLHNIQTIETIKNILNSYSWELQEWYFEYHRVQFFAQGMG